MIKTIQDLIEANDHPLRFIDDKSGRSHYNVVIICDSCNGEGFIPVTEFKGHSKGLEIEDHECHKCKGTGRLSVDINITVKPYKQNSHEETTST